MGLLHLRNAQKIDDIKVIAVADKSRKGIAEAQRFGITQVFSDYASMARECTLDAVILSLPNHLHEESVIEFTEHGVHIFIEKPLGRTLEECERIQRTVTAAGTLLVVGHNYRYYDHVQRLKNELDTGSLGEVVIANLDLFTNGPFAHPMNPVPVPEWWFNGQNLGGGALLDLGYHLADLFNWFFPQATPVYTYLGYRYNLSMEDSAIVVVKSEATNTYGVLSTGWFQRMVFPNFNFKITLQGTVNVKSTDHFLPRNPYLHAGKEVVKNIVRRVLGKEIRPLSYTYYFPSYFQELRDFVTSIQQNQYSNSMASITTGYDTMRIIDSAYNIAKQHH